MSRQLISQHQAKLERLVQYGGSRNEGSVRAAFQELLDRYAASKQLALITELEYKSKLGTTVRPDGTLKNAVRQDVGYWESKDERDDLDAEIALKLGKGYPDSNILFDDTRQVVLIQNAHEVGRAPMDDLALLHVLLEQFVGFETPFVRTFREAISHFQDDLPDLLRHLREAIGAQAGENAQFREKQSRLLELVLDSQTTLSGVPAAAWDYKLGNRSALEWVLERYRERTPKDKTVAEKFNTYSFADYKEDVIVLLGRVCAVSVATVEVVGEMVEAESE
jgi:hypothetical protein